MYMLVNDKHKQIKSSRIALERVKNFHVSIKYSETALMFYIVSQTIQHYHSIYFT